MAAVVGFARTKFLAVRVRGASMEPTFFDGDLVIAARMARHMRRGGIVVFYEPHQDRPGVATPMPQSAPPSPTAAAAVALVVKRIAAVPGDRLPPELWARLGRESLVPADRIAVLSDNPAGADSRIWGYIPLESIVGLIVLPRPRALCRQIGRRD
jgi:signal peptidase I